MTDWCACGSMIEDKSGRKDGCDIAHYQAAEISKSVKQVVTLDRSV